jgi:hypothetical protein
MRLMDGYIRAVQLRLRQKKFLKERGKLVRVRGNAVGMTYKPPATVRTPCPKDKTPQKEEFF